MLGSHFYNSIVRKNIIAFGTLFNNIEMKSTNPDTGEVLETIKVPLNYGPKQKFLVRLAENNASSKVAISLPRIYFEMNNVEYDPSRKTSPIQQYKTIIADNGNEVRVQYVPVPYNLSFELGVIAKSQDDALQIVEQILPFFTPDFTVTMTTVPNTSEKRDVPIVLQDVSYTDEYEGDFQSRRVITWTLNFEMKTYLYGSISSSEIIRDVRARTYITDDGQVDVNAGRQSEIKQVPNPTNVSPETSPLNITETINFFDGNDFDYNTDKSNI